MTARGAVLAVAAMVVWSASAGATLWAQETAGSAETAAPESAAPAAEAVVEAPYLGGHTPQAVLGYFRTQKHPYLFVTEKNRELLKERIASDDPVWAEAWSGIRQAVVGYHMPGVAFRLAMLGAEDKAAKATADNLREWSPPWKDGQKWWANYQTAANVIGRLQAFDAVRGLGLLSDEDEAAFGAKIADLIDTKGLHVGLRNEAWTGNINESIAIMQCLAAIVLANHPRAEAWYRDGSQLLQMAYDETLNGANLACEAEGQTYQVGFAYQVLANLAIPLEENGFAVVRRDDNFLEECFDWTVWSLRPDTIYPTTEDAWMNNTLGGIWAARYASPEVRRTLMWHFARLGGDGGKGRNLGRGTEAVAALLAWNPKEVPQWPEGPRTRFSERASVAVFATDWTKSSSWLYFLGDRTPWRYEYYGFKNCANNKPHAHGDQTSFTLYALGKYLATETARFSGAKAENHNVLLVDGNGEAPSAFEPKQFTTLSRTFDVGTLAGATMQCAYAGVTNRRSVLCVRPTAGGKEREYFVIFDDVAAEGEHSYEWRLHNREKDAAIEATGQMAKVTVGDVAMDVVFVRPALESIGVEDAKLPSYTEKFIGAKAKATGDVRWMTLLLPRRSSEAELRVGVVGEGAVAITQGDSQDVIVTGVAGTETKTSAGVATDAAAAMVRTTGEKGEKVAAACLRDGRTVSVGGTVVLEASEPVESAAVVFAEGRATLDVTSSARTTLTLRQPDGSVGVVKTVAGRQSGVTVELRKP